MHCKQLVAQFNRFFPCIQECDNKTSVQLQLIRLLYIPFHRVNKNSIIFCIAKLSGVVEIYQEDFLIFLFERDPQHFFDIISTVSPEFQTPI